MVNKLSKLDAIDIKLLSVAQEHGKVSRQILADKVGLTSSVCATRLKRLESLGFIQGYEAVIDISKFVDPIYATVFVTLIDTSASTHRAFQQFIEPFEEITQFLSVSGDADYILRFCGRDAEHYSAFLRKLLREGPHIASIKDYFASRTIKEETIFPLERAVKWSQQTV